ncbi:hypothetical protein [Celeribacter sp.]|uniref:hypothetical protein n=1 Tax=Celeribacter sp. TaxID=1890673 RepID=UPI003A90C871
MVVLTVFGAIACSLATLVAGAPVWVVVATYSLSGIAILMALAIARYAMGNGAKPAPKSYQHETLSVTH